MLGLLALMLLNGQKWKDRLKENLTVQVYLQNDLEEDELSKVKKLIDAESFSKEAEYITQEQASKIMEEELGEEFVDFLGYYPIPPSIDIKLFSEYSTLDSLKWIEEEILAITGVKEVEYQKVYLENIEANISKWSFPILIFGGLLMIIAIALINNTIRLSIFSKRFLIKSMQLVGATHSFIRRPFIWQGILYGIISGFLAFSIILGIATVLKREAPELMEQQDLPIFIQLFGILFVLGIIIAGVSTVFAVNRYIRLGHDKLY